MGLNERFAQNKALKREKKAMKEKNDDITAAKRRRYQLIIDMRKVPSVYKENLLILNALRNAMYKHYHGLQQVLESEYTKKRQNILRLKMIQTRELFQNTQQHTINLNEKVNAIDEEYRTQISKISIEENEKLNKL